MAYVEAHQAIANHPKTKRLRRELDIRIPEAVGIVILTQHWAIDYAPDGDLAEIDPADLADGVHWEGKPADLLKALKSAGFIDPDGRLHNWQKYGGKYIKKRDQGRVRQENKRERDAGKGEEVPYDDELPWDEEAPF